MASPSSALGNSLSETVRAWPASSGRLSANKICKVYKLAWREVGLARFQALAACKAASASAALALCADVSMLKIRGTEIQQALTELMMQAVGPMSQPFKAVDAGHIDHVTSRLAPRYFNYRKASIYAGSNEIQRNIIAKASLGL